MWRYGLNVVSMSLDVENILNIFRWHLQYIFRLVLAWDISVGRFTTFAHNMSQRLWTWFSLFVSFLARCDIITIIWGRKAILCMYMYIHVPVGCIFMCVDLLKTRNSRDEKGRWNISNFISVRGETHRT